MFESQNVFNLPKIRTSLFCLLYFIVSMLCTLTTQGQNVSRYNLTSSSLPLSSGSLNLGSTESLVISSIEIKFEDQLATQSDIDSIRDVIEIHPGEEFSKSKIRKAIIKLYQSGRAVNVQTFSQETSQKNEIILSFIITRPIRIKSIKFTGTGLLNQDEIQPKLSGLQVGAKYSEQLLDQGTKTLAEIYRNNGYFKTKIEHTINLTSNDGADILYQITPNEQAQIGDWKITGNLKLNLVDVENKIIKNHKGNFYTEAQINSDIEKIRQMHLSASYLNPQISTAKTKYDEQTNRVNISINVNSGPLVALTVEGFSLSASKKREVLPILRDGSLDDFVLEEGQHRLLNHVQRAGYFFAEVDFTREVHGADSAQIIYKVNKNQRYHIADIRIIGTKEFSYKDISEELSSKIGETFPPSRGFTSQEILNSDAGLITRKLQNLGYLKADVVEKRIGITPNNENIIITFVIDSGERTFIKDVTIVGNTNFSNEELISQLSYNTGEYFSQSHLNEDLGHLYSLYEKSGYAEVRISSEMIEPEPNQIHLTYKIEEGKVIYINRIVINTRGRTSKDAIRAYLLFREGDLLQRSQLSQSEQLLYSTGAFKQVIIRPEFVRDTSEGSLQDIFIDVIESNAYTIAYGLGYQRERGTGDKESGGSPRLSFEISNNNMFGRLQTASLIFRLSKLERLGQFSYQFSRPFGAALPVLTSFFYQRRQEVSFGSERFTSLVQVKKDFNLISSLIFRYSFENIRVFNLQVSEASLPRSDQSIKIGRLSTTYLRDTRDSVLDTTKGSFSIADFSVASTKLGGSIKYLKLFGEHQEFHKLPKMPSIIFASSARVGLAKPYGNIESQNPVQLPISERFFTGGATTLRGFSFEQAGPRDKETDRPIGGNALVVLNAEMRFPITSRLQGVTFCDTGNIFEKTSDIKLSDFKHTIGAGLRIKTPLGPFRVDFGYLINPPLYVAIPPPDPPKPLNKFKIQLSFGQAF